MILKVSEKELLITETNTKRLTMTATESLKKKYQMINKKYEDIRTFTTNVSKSKPILLSKLQKPVIKSERVKK